MTTQVQFRKGTTSEHAIFTGANAEITVDTEKKTAVVHDGSDVGGVCNDLVRISVSGCTFVVIANDLFGVAQIAKHSVSGSDDSVRENMWSKWSTKKTNYIDLSSNLVICRNGRRLKIVLKNDGPRGPPT